jgi:hypothetical protein
MASIADPCRSTSSHACSLSFYRPPYFSILFFVVSVADSYASFTLLLLSTSLTRHHLSCILLRLSDSVIVKRFTLLRYIWVVGFISFEKPLPLRCF